MKTIVVDGKQIAGKILDRTKKMILRHRLKPVLAVVLVGNNKASATYIRRKMEAAHSIGIKFLLYKFPVSAKLVQVVARMRQIQEQKLSGLIVQLPLPKTLDKKIVLNQIDPELDVDFLTWESLGQLMIGENRGLPPVAETVLEILKHHKIDYRGKHVVLVGQGDLIGKPLTNMFMRLPVTLTTCNVHTKDLKSMTRQADILITGVGQANLIKGDMIKPGAVVIDAGVSFKNGKMFGDVNFKSVLNRAKLITPVPGGFGPITVAKLLENTAKNAREQKLSN